MADGRLRAVGDDRRLGQLGVVLGADALHLLAHPLAGQAVRQLAHERRRRGHRGVGSGLRAADAGQLGRGLDAPAQVEGVGVDPQLQPLLAEAVGPGEREVGRHDRVLHADLAERPQVALELGLEEADAGVEQLVQPELERVDHLDAQPERLDAVALEHAVDAEAAVVDLGVEERVEDVDRDRVEEVGRGARSGAEEDRLAHAGWRIASSRASSSGTWRVKRP